MSITSVQGENRKFFAKKEFSEKANLKSFEEYKEMYDFSIQEPEKFWAEQAKKIDWLKPCGCREHIRKRSQESARNARAPIGMLRKRRSKICPYFKKP